MSSNFNPDINVTPINPKNTGYGRTFCNYPRRRVDYEINKGMESYQFSFLKNDHEPQSLNPRPETRNKGVLDSYDKGSPIQKIQGYSTPYPGEKRVQDRTIPLNNDLCSPDLKMAPSKSQRFPVRTTFEGKNLPRVTMPNPNIPVYNHIIPYQMVSQFGECPCDPQYQKAEHVWSNGTRVKGYDPRLAQANNRRYQEAIQTSRPFPRFGVDTCFLQKKSKSKSESQ